MNDLHFCAFLPLWFSVNLQQIVPAVTDALFVNFSFTTGTVGFFILSPKCLHANEAYDFGQQIYTSYVQYNDPVSLTGYFCYCMIILYTFASHTILITFAY